MRVNIFIRKENEDKWNNIPNKSEWINTLLSNSDDTSRFGETKQTPVGPVVEVLSETIRSKGEILAEIKQLERQRDEELEYCQDPDTIKEVGDNYQKQIQALWEEYTES